MIRMSSRQMRWLTCTRSWGTLTWQLSFLRKCLRRMLSRGTLSFLDV
uniref:Uncharacterized protein n=1 Tax=Arundo donax TaxID=35708 RepID=A0A0A9HCL6_ARUDO